MVYKFAQRSFSRETLDKINDECENFEIHALEAGTQNKYIALIEELENGI